MSEDSSIDEQHGEDVGVLLLARDASAKVGIRRPNPVGLKMRNCATE